MVTFWPRRLLAIAGAAALAACASSSPPASLVQARGELSTAEKAPPATYSPAELREAQMKLGQAESAARSDNRDDADRLAREAMADLHLSRSLADAQQAQRAADDLQAAIDTLKSEAGRPTAVPSPQPPAGQPPR